MKIGDTLNVDIIDEDNIGNGIAKYNNIIIFIKYALKDENIDIEITNIKSKYLIGKIVKIIKPSKYRIDNICPYYDKCGGCNFLHTTYSNEKNIKLKYLEKLFNKEVSYLKINNELNYRNKVTLHVKDNKIGFYNDKTHSLIEIDYCYLLDDKINNIIKEIKKYDLSYINEIMIRVINNKIMLNIVSDYDDLDIFNIKCDSLYLNNVFIKGEEYLIDEINGYKFSIYPDSFYQINKEGMVNIYNKAKELLGNYKTLLDLYCGTGTIGIWVNNNSKIVGAEINKSSIKNAKINLKLNNINNIEFICDDAKNINGEFDSIIVDPPRSGLSKEVANYLNNSKSNRIVYISCNPNTLKRDIDLLNNYELVNISYTDMFPRTKHIETVILLEKNGV